MYRLLRPSPALPLGQEIRVSQESGVESRPDIHGRGELLFDQADPVWPQRDAFPQKARRIVNGDLGDRRERALVAELPISPHPLVQIDDVKQ